MVKYLHGYFKQLRDNPTPRGSIHSLFPLELPVATEGAPMYWHCSDVPYSMLSKQHGCVFIERRSPRGGKRLVHQGNNMPKLSFNLEYNLEKKARLTPKEKAPQVMEVFAASTFPDAWSHVVHKPFAERTMLVVGFNPNCAAYKYMRKSDHAYLRTDKCDILLANADGSPGPGVFVAEATDGAVLLRVLVNTLSVTSDELSVRPTLPEGVCLICPTGHVQPGSMLYGDAGE
jgi:hypothetical protein